MPILLSKSSTWTIAMLCGAGMIATPQTFTALVNFDGTNGSSPARVTLVQGLDGDLYGTTSQGGTNGLGTVFKMTSAGALTTLYSFTGSPGGASPEAGLVLATDGNFYGTTAGGGTIVSYPTCPSGCGTVFKITPTGSLTTLHDFAITDGADAVSPPIQASDGNFYGTTADGGINSQCVISYGCGTVYKMTPEGTVTTLHSFRGTDGAGPDAMLVQGTDGKLYGTTCCGADSNAWAGTVFKITLGGTFTTLYTFCNSGLPSPCPTSAGPSGLVQATNGNFYGVNSGVPAPHAGVGTVFKISSTGTLTTLFRFGRQIATYGSIPFAGLIQATDGNLYGATSEGGANGGGTIFEITPRGVLNTLYSFSGFTGSGLLEPTGLLQATDGNFYSTTYQGGSNSEGTVFSLSVGLSPFVKMLPAYGKVAAPIYILGTNLTGATAVSFNGTPATFTVASATEITTSVPAGATTGSVKVRTPAGCNGNPCTLSGNVPFIVLP